MGKLTKLSKRAVACIPLFAGAFNCSESNAQDIFIQSESLAAIAEACIDKGYDSIQLFCEPDSDGKMWASGGCHCKCHSKSDHSKK